MDRRTFLRIFQLSLMALPVTTARAQQPYLTPENFGADPSGGASSNLAFIQMFERSMQTGIGCVCDVDGAVYRLNAPLRVETRGRQLSFFGRGPSSTKIIVDGSFTGLSVVGTAGREAAVTLADFSITRSRYSDYTGPLGKRSLEVFLSRATLRNIDESGSIGFGIFLDRCLDYEISHCYVHDHINGKNQKSGTDGIHVYRSAGPGKVFNNVVERVGDDAISFGSFALDAPTTNFECYSNQTTDTAGGLKIYGNSHSFKVYNNVVRGVISAGVMIYDDRNQAESFPIYDGEIYGNTISGQVGGGVGGGISCWSPIGDGSGFQRDISIHDNVIEDGNFGITLASQAPHKSVGNILVVNNAISRMRSSAFFVDGYANQITIMKNKIFQTGLEAAYLGKPAPAHPPGQAQFSNNDISNYGFSDFRRYALRRLSSKWIISGNNISGNSDKWISPN